MAALRGSLRLHLFLRRWDHVLRWLLQLILLWLGFLPLLLELLLCLQTLWLMQPWRILHLWLLLLQPLATPRCAAVAACLPLLLPASWLRWRILHSSWAWLHLCRCTIISSCWPAIVKYHFDAEHLDGVDAGDVEACRGARDLAKIARA